MSMKRKTTTEAYNLTGVVEELRITERELRAEIKSNRVRKALYEAKAKNADLASQIESHLDCKRALIDDYNLARDQIKHENGVVAQLWAELAESRAEVQRLRAELRAEETSGNIHRELNGRAAKALGKPFEGPGSSWHDIPEAIDALNASLSETLRVVGELIPLAESQAAAAVLLGADRVEGMATISAARKLVGRLKPLTPAGFSPR